MKIKQIISLLLSAGILCSFAACASLDSEKKEISSGEGSSKGESIEETIEETVCFSEKGVTVTAVSFDANRFLGKGVQLSIENSSENDYTVGIEALAVNHSEITDLFSCTVASGKTANDTIELMSSELEKAGIDVVGQIDVIFKLIDPDNYNTVFTSQMITLRTSAYDESLLKPDDQGTVLYDKNEVRIIGKYAEKDPIWGTSILLYVENNRKEEISVSCDDLSVDGVMVSSLFSASVHSGMHAYDEISLLDDDRNELDFDNIHSVELKFHIYRADNFDTIEKTKAITFEVNP